jgi:hypothetical protein
MASGIKGQNDTNLTRSYQIVSDCPIRAAGIAYGGRRAKLLGEPGFKRIRRESGTFEWRKFGLRRHPALVIFVRVRVVGTLQERFDTLFEHSMPQHKTARPHTRGR